MLQVRRVLNDKAHDNLDRLETLEKKLKLLIRLKIMSDKTLKQLRLENNDIREPLSRAQSNVTLFEEKLDQSRKLKEDLQRNQQMLRTLSKRVEESLWQYEVLYQDYKSLEVEDDRRRQKLENDAINFYGECNIYS
jgi:paraquat-inducible protein B